MRIGYPPGAAGLLARASSQTVTAPAGGSTASVSPASSAKVKKRHLQYLFRASDQKVYAVFGLFRCTIKVSERPSCVGKDARRSRHARPAAQHARHLARNAGDK